ncbi:MAG: hypothetical protein ACE5EC_04305 [Phycisphaerae bacterium]
MGESQDSHTPVDTANTISTPQPSAGSEILTFDTYQQPREATPEPGSDWQRHRLGLLDAALAIVFVALTLYVRMPFIERGETLLHSDEAIVGLMAQDIAAGERFPIYFYGQRYMGALEAYVIAAVSPFFDNPIHALRFGPACFFAGMVAVQYLMLTRWFGRRGGLVGAVVLLAASPMFMQWSISARGGYVEILLWGSLLLWTYSEWFVNPQSAIGNRQFFFGALIGSGLWINPSIALFIVPIAIHALLNRPLAALHAAPVVGAPVRRAVEMLRHGSLLVAALFGVLLLNVFWAVWVADGKVHSQLLLGLLPKPAALGVLVLLGVITLGWAAKRTRLIESLRSLITRNGGLILGILAGSAPALLYTVQTLVGDRSMDPSLPLGFRPLWLTGETMIYLLNGLPLVFGADPQPFLQLVGVGRDTVTRPIDLVTAGTVMAASFLVAGSLVTGLMVLLHSQRAGLSRLFRLIPTNHSPAMLLILGFGGTLVLYVLGGCTLDFTTIRYLVPLWVFLPGLIAAIFVSRRFRAAALLVPMGACTGWIVGQTVMYQQLGAPHPLRALATSMVDRKIDPAVAEPLDAHLLSYLTRQQCRTIEFESFWPRLGHYFPLLEPDRPMGYVVETGAINRTQDWIDGGWPGKAPPETHRFLWPRLRRVLNTRPDLVEQREPLCDGYEYIRLRKPLNDRNLRSVKDG